MKLLVHAQKFNYENILYTNHIKIIEEYIGDSGYLNIYMRYGENGLEEEVKDRKKRNDIEEEVKVKKIMFGEIYQTLLPYNVTEGYFVQLYRGQKNIQKEIEKKIIQNNEYNCYQDDGFMSTSTLWTISRAFAPNGIFGPKEKGIFMTIFLIPGQDYKILPLQLVNPEEREIIIRNDSYLLEIQTIKKPIQEPDYKYYILFPNKKSLNTFNDYSIIERLKKHIIIPDSKLNSFNVTLNETLNEPLKATNNEDPISLTEFYNKNVIPYIKRLQEDHNVIILGTRKFVSMIRKHDVFKYLTIESKMFILYLHFLFHIAYTDSCREIDPKFTKSTENPFISYFLNSEYNAMLKKASTLYTMFDVLPTLETPTKSHTLITTILNKIVTELKNLERNYEYEYAVYSERFELYEYFEKINKVVNGPSMQSMQKEKKLPANSQNINALRKQPLVVPFIDINTNHANLSKLPSAFLAINHLLNKITNAIVHMYNWIPNSQKSVYLEMKITLPEKDMIVNFTPTSKAIIIRSSCNGGLYGEETVRIKHVDDVNVNNIYKLVDEFFKDYSNFERLLFIPKYICHLPSYITNSSVSLLYFALEINVKITKNEKTPNKLIQLKNILQSKNLKKIEYELIDSYINVNRFMDNTYLGVRPLRTDGTSKKNSGIAYGGGRMVISTRE
jgi:hypothetical protein